MPLIATRQRCWTCRISTASWAWADGRHTCSICGRPRQHFLDGPPKAPAKRTEDQPRVIQDRTTRMTEPELKQFTKEFKEYLRKRKSQTARKR